ALRGLERLAVYDPEFVEEPVAGLEALAALRLASPVPIAVDESAGSPEEVARAVSMGAADVVVLKPSALGGPSASAEVAARVRDAGLDVVVTSLL
ncbi:o-succinylbenzoate synthase, partial [bacterium]|nr:o-succinylbenzoate synthase [bacterium]